MVPSLSILTDEFFCLWARGGAAGNLPITFSRCDSFSVTFEQEKAYVGNWKAISLFPSFFKKFLRLLAVGPG